MKDTDKNNHDNSMPQDGSTTGLPESLKVLGLPADSEKFEAYYPQYIHGNVRVEWDGSGSEGVSGEYDPDDPEDIHLLRFYVARKDGDEWTECDDASYCTNFPADATDAQKMAGLKIIMHEVFDTVSEGVSSIKKTCERLSWIGLDWLNEEGTDTCPYCGLEYSLSEGHSCMEGRCGGGMD